MTLQEETVEAPVADAIPSPRPQEEEIEAEGRNDNDTTTDDDNEEVDDDAQEDGAPIKKKKTRRSRRGGYRRKRQQQKKVAALMAEAAAKRALAKQMATEESPEEPHQEAGEDVCDGASTASTATTEEESSSCESTTSSTQSPERACARKKNQSQLTESTGTMRHNAKQYWKEYKKQQFAKKMYQQQQQHQANYEYYKQGLGGMMQPQMYPPAYGGGYGYPPRQAPPRRPRANNRKSYLTKEDTERYVALDCEMVGVGPHGKDSALARVTLIDWNGNVIMDELVKPQWEVTDYRSFVSGITKEMLDSATMDFATVQFKVMKHLRGKILVGHGLKNDLAVLGINHPWYMIRDTAKYEPYMKVRFSDGCLWPRGLKELTAEKLGKAIQVYGRPHCPKEDAMAALDLYKLVWRQWESSIEYRMSKIHQMAYSHHHHPAAQHPHQHLAGPPAGSRAAPAYSIATY